MAYYCSALLCKQIFEPVARPGPAQLHGTWWWLGGWQCFESSRRASSVSLEKVGQEFNAPLPSAGRSQVGTRKNEAFVPQSCFSFHLALLHCCLWMTIFLALVPTDGALCVPSLSPHLPLSSTASAIASGMQPLEQDRRKNLLEGRVLVLVYFLHQLNLPGYIRDASCTITFLLPWVSLG